MLADPLIRLLKSWSSQQDSIWSYRLSSFLVLCSDLFWFWSCTMACPRCQGHRAAGVMATFFVEMLSLLQDFVRMFRRLFDICKTSAWCRTLFARSDVCLTFAWRLPGAGLCSQAETFAWREGLQIKNRWIAGRAYRCWDCPRDGKFCKSLIWIRQEPALLLVVGGEQRSGTHPAVAGCVSLYLIATEWLQKALTDDGIDHAAVGSLLCIWEAKMPLSVGCKRGVQMLDVVLRGMPFWRSNIHENFDSS